MSAPKLQFLTKAQTLAQLKPRLRTASVLPLVYFSVGEWRDDAARCLSRISAELEGPWIVRSSSALEDQAAASLAGAFLTMPNVPRAGLREAVDKVIESYGSPGTDNEVLVQAMLRNVQYSGVALSHDPASCAPYRVINWVEGTDTTIVTGGQGGRTWQQAANSKVAPPAPLGKVVALLDELLALFGGTPIDCEFAITREGSAEVPWLLQARPLVLSRDGQSAAEQGAYLERIEYKIARGMSRHPFLMGSRTVYGVMPDWNPAEIIGIRPKPLALSLYRDLVTDSIWAYQRHNYGYRNLRSFPLMPHFFGLPYIDVRLSFNSFIPADLDPGLADRLVDFYISKLLAEPTLHDKVEFEIVFSCYTLDLQERLAKLADSQFNEAERGAIAESLRRLTNRIVHHSDGLWKADAAKLDRLAARRSELLQSKADVLEQIYWLLEDTKRYGTLPFAGIARAAFIAVQILKSLVAIGVFSQADYDGFMAGLTTVGSRLAYDRATLGKQEFLELYGHLRPGTYDILSPRYDAAPELYFDWDRRPPVPEPRRHFALTLPQMRALKKQLAAHGLQGDPVELLDFLQSAIELREQAKFLFTRNLSDIIERIAELGEVEGLSRADMAFCDVMVVKELYVGAADIRDTLQRSIEQGKARYAETLKIALPPLIASPEDVWAFEWPATVPNFITQKQVTAPVVACDVRQVLNGAVVCIPSADPGFDWLFAYPIGGLITAWGGANSHMAIRAGELGLPAVIGAGEALYQRWSQAERLHIDCANRRVEVLA